MEHLKFASKLKYDIEMKLVTPEVRKRQCLIMPRLLILFIRVTLNRGEGCAVGA